MRTSTNAFNGETTVNVPINLGRPAIGLDYTSVPSGEGETVLKDVGKALDERINIRYNELSSMSGKGLKAIYPKTGKGGIEVRVTDSFIRESVDDTTSVINDDPVQVELTLRFKDGSNVITGADVLPMIMHLLGFVLDVEEGTGESAGTYKLTDDQLTLSRLISGATKPVALFN